MAKASPKPGMWPAADTANSLRSSLNSSISLFRLPLIISSVCFGGAYLLLAAFLDDISMCAFHPSLRVILSIDKSMLNQ